MNTMDAQQARALLADATARGDALANLIQLEAARQAVQARKARGGKPAVPGIFALPEPRKPIAAQPRKRKPGAEPIKATLAEQINLGPPERWGTQLPEED